MSKSNVSKKSEAVPAAMSQNYFQKFGQAATGQWWIGTFAVFDKFGSYTRGKEKIEIQRGTKAAAYMPTLCAGWQHWENSSVIERIMGPVGEGYVLPPRSELGFDDKNAWESFDDGRPRDPWQFTSTLVFKEMEGEQFFTFTTSSKGGLNALRDLSKTYGDRMRAHPDEWPIVALERGSYQHPDKRIGEVRYPIFRIVGYVSIKDLPPIEGFGPAPAVEGPAGAKGNF